MNRADFSGSDLRGCDFSKAQLIEANFERAKTGPTAKQLLMGLLICVVIGCPVADTITRLIFAVMGQSPEDEAWPFVLMLHGVLGIAGTAASIRAIHADRHKAMPTLERLSGSCVGALIGFFYIGSLTDNNAMLAIAGAVIAAGLTVWIGLKWRSCSKAIAFSTADVVSIYGLAFLLGTTAFACLSSQEWGWGVLLSILSIIYIGLTVEAIGLVVQAIRCTGGTSFRGANLTKAKFDGAKLHDADFSDAIGFWK